MSSSRSSQTLRIEAMVKEGRTLSSIAKDVGVSRRRVQQIKSRVFEDYQLVTASAHMRDGAATRTPVAYVKSQQMKALQLNLSPAVHDALVEACDITNRRNPSDEYISITEYVEELVINRLAELGLLKRRRKQ